MTSKEIFEAIDLEKVGPELKTKLLALEKATEGFTNERADARMETSMNAVYNFIKDKKPEALKNVEVKTVTVEETVTKTQGGKKVRTKQTIRKKVAGKRKKNTKKTPTPSAKNPMPNVPQIAREIREEGESWSDALSRAKVIYNKKKDDQKVRAKKALDDLRDFMKSDKFLKGWPRTYGKENAADNDLERDLARSAKAPGRRISKTGRVYYENRDNRSDREANTFPRKIYLKGGGKLPEGTTYYGVNEIELVELQDGTKLSPAYGVDSWMVSGIYVSPKSTAKKDEFQTELEFAKGGLTKSDYFYIPRAEVKRVVLDEALHDSEEIDGDKVLNGIWMKKTDRTKQLEKEFSAREAKRRLKKMELGGEVYVQPTIIQNNPDYLVGTSTMYEMFELGGEVMVQPTILQNNPDYITSTATMSDYFEKGGSVNELKVNRKKLSNDLWDRRGYDYKYLDKLSDKKLKSLWDTEFYYDTEFLYDKGGYVAVSEKDGYWYIISKPTSKEEAQQVIDMGVPNGEMGKVVTLDEAKAYKKVIGREYLEKGGSVSKLLTFENNYFDQKMSYKATKDALVDDDEKVKGSLADALDKAIEGLGGKFEVAVVTFYMRDNPQFSGDSWAVYDVAFVRVTPKGTVKVVMGDDYDKYEKITGEKFDFDDYIASVNYEKGGAIGLIKISLEEIEDSDFQALGDIFETNDAMFSIDEDEEYVIMDLNELPDDEDKDEALEIIGKYQVEKMAKGGNVGLPSSQYHWDEKHPYIFTIYFANGEKESTDWYDLVSAIKMKAILTKDKLAYKLFYSKDGVNLEEAPAKYARGGDFEKKDEYYFLVRNSDAKDVWEMADYAFGNDIDRGRIEVLFQKNKYVIKDFELAKRFYQYLRDRGVKFFDQNFVSESVKGRVKFAKGGAMEHMIMKGDKVLAIHKNMVIVESDLGQINVIDLSTEPIARRISIEPITGKNTIDSAIGFIDSDASFKSRMMAMGGSLQGHGLKEGDLIVEDLGSSIMVLDEDGETFYVDLREGERYSEEPLPFDNGGEVKANTIARLAAKYNKNGQEVDKAIWEGSSVELEHTSSRYKAMLIAIDHLEEDFYYYQKLKAAEGKPDFSDFYEKGGQVPEKFLDSKGERKIDAKSIEELTDYVMALPQTKSIYFNQEAQEYVPSRRKLHADIINKFKEEVVCITEGQPIAIFMGGSPASGKSSFLRKYSPYLLKEEILKVDADEIRAMLPEYEGYNAAQTHLETKDIVNTLLSDKNIGIPCDFDLIYDGTMNSVKSYIPLMDILRKRGYKIFIVYMDKVPKDVIIKRALERYKKSGRFVPLEVIEDFFEKGTAAFNQLKKDVDGYMVIDGSNQDYEIIEQGGIKLPTNREYSKLGSKIDPKDIPALYKKGGKTKKA